jgi:hypothetical protein
MPVLAGRRRTAAIVLGIAAALVVSVASCGDDPTAPEDAPEGHTVVVDGVTHAPGLQNPAANCVECHGAQLTGGTDGEPSCFSCHGQKW